MKYLLFAFCFFFASVSNLFGQVYQIGHVTINFIDATRNNRSIPTEIYYPSDTTGDNVPMTSLNNIKFPSLVFGHGFVMTWDVYQNFWSTLVPNGYIMAFPKTESSFSPSHLEYGKDLAFVINQINALGLQSTSLFYDRVSIMNCAMGHSMGGGASFLAVPLNSNIKTIANFAPAETTPSAISAAATISIPALLFAGANDCVTPAVTNQVPMYSGLISSCKTYININGASHCQMANNNTFCSIGESSCTPAPTISRTVQHAKIFSYLLPWLDYQLKGNCNQGFVFDSQIATDTSITFQKNCNQCTSLLTEEWNISKEEIAVYPNPARDYINFKSSNRKEFNLSVFDSNSKVVFQQKFIESIRVDASKFPSGIYYYEVSNSNNTINKGKFIKE